MKELNTIQKREKLNRVFAADETGPGGANHEYVIVSDKGLQVSKETKIVFQKGPRNEENSQQGILDTDLLEIVRDRYKAFQAGPFASKYNEKVLEHIEIALMYANRRVEDRIERNVLGRNEK